MTDIARQDRYEGRRRVASPHPLGGAGKRIFDIVAATLGLILLSPLFLMVAVLVRMHDGGHILYGHRRIGCGGRPFYCLKFRTMVCDGDKVLRNHLRSDPAAAAEWAATRKLKDDPRVTRVGRVLRALSIDELPQLFNIIRGEMSVVGPRPVVDEELDKYGADANCYLDARPGLTGLWQVSGRSDVSYETRVSFDRFYFSNWSFIFDCKIVAMTIPAVLSSRGSY